MDEDTRTCSACGETKPRDQFPRYAKCRACLAAYGREYRRKNPAKMRELDAAAYGRNPEAKKARDRAHYAANRERRQSKAREAYANEDREARNAVRKVWRDANRHRFADYTKRYRDKNPLVTSVTNGNRRTRLAGLKVGVSELQSLWTGLCALCGDPIDSALKWPDQQSKSVDHIIPLAKGGLHEVTNLQWAHVGCNRRKSDKIL